MARKEQLSRDRILTAARHVVEQEGMGGLSMRRLAQELDVWPMSVYRYFQDKDALLDAVAASAAEEFELPPRRGSWRTQIVQLLESARARLASDPEGVSGRLGRAFFEPGALRLSEAALEILTGAGLSEPEAASAWRALWSYVFGFATFTAAPAPWASGALAEVFADDDEFKRGLDRLLDGVEARVRQVGAAR